jgi:hypothetical protein
MSSFVTSIFLAATVSVGATVSASDNAPRQESGQTPKAASVQAEASDIRRVVKNEKNVFIVDDQGRKLKGSIGELKADGLVLHVGRDRTDVPYDRIVRIDRRRDGVLNGALIGFGAGAGLGLLGALAASTDDSGWGSPNPADVARIAPMILGGIGAGIGLGVDALMGRETNLYRREGATHISLSPALGRGRRGVAISVAW